MKWDYLGLAGFLVALALLDRLVGDFAAASLVLGVGVVIEVWKVWSVDSRA